MVGPGVEEGTVLLHPLGPDGAAAGPVRVVPEPWLAEAVAAIEAGEAEAGGPVRWVWDTTRWYPGLLEAGVRVERCHDLRLCHAILRGSVLTAGSALATAPPGPWDRPAAPAPEPAGDEDALFPVTDVLPARPAPTALPAGRPADRPAGDGSGPDHATPEAAAPGPDRAGGGTGGDAPGPDRAGGVGPEEGEPDPVAELRHQLAAVAGSGDPGRLRLLLAAESAGALIAAEMHHDGLPWRADVHDAYLTRVLGPRPPEGVRPARMEELARQIRTHLAAPALNPDSQRYLLRALRLAGVPVGSTSKWELSQVDHPVVAPLLEYKKLHRLLTANGWVWADTWATGGRFRPDYVPGGVVTGRWASSGGGALQLPTSIRAAARADPGWRLVVADAAQLEPRVLAAMSGDGTMATAARHADLYQGVVDAGILATRSEAKYAMLGAIYGATTGPSAVLMPRLTAAYPRAVALVEEAARAGERGERVRTWLGRTSPLPGPAWQEAVAAAAAEDPAPDAARVARARRRDWGRFTRNFVVQGTAAEWALCWLAGLRRRLAGMGEVDAGAADAGATATGPHLVFFLHDEVVVHAPAEAADDVARAVREAADEAGRLLFGDCGVEWALSVAVVDGYDEAK